MMNNKLDNLKKLSFEKQVAFVLETMQAKIHKLERAGKDPIAIIGMGCRLPGGIKDEASYLNLLLNGLDAVSEAPEGRWNLAKYFSDDADMAGKSYVRHAGFLKRIDGFDAPFFGIPRLEAENMDPQHRMLLETAGEAIENAGIPFHSLRESSTGVFIGISQTDYGFEELSESNLANISSYSATGIGPSFASGRISYTWGLQGPSITLDTACSSSLVAIHQACRSLAMGDCTLAIAGAAHILLCEEVNVALSKAKALSKTGKCKTFSADADGYVRGEGCGVVILKKLSEAIKDKDHVLAVIKGSAVNHDGASSGFTVPNGKAQQKVIRQALKNAEVATQEVSYVEAHGTGTQLGDPIEVEALMEVLGKNRKLSNPLRIGAVKTNIGHLEPAAGMASIIKVVLALKHKTIFPLINFTSPNKYISLDSLPLEFPLVPMAWQPVNNKRIAGISGFGLGGTNAHIILEEAPQPANDLVQERLEKDRQSSYLLCLSAKSIPALAELARRYLAVIPTKDLANICYSSKVSRSHFNKRLALIAASKEELLQQLNKQLSTIQNERETSLVPPKIAFWFSGNHPLLPEKIKELYNNYPVFRGAVDQCRGILQDSFGQKFDPLEPFQRDCPLESAIFKSLSAFTSEYALAKLWLSWDVIPEMLLIDEKGKYAAFCIAGVLTPEIAIDLLVCHQLLGSLTFRVEDGGFVVSLAERYNFPIPSTKEMLEEKLLRLTQNIQYSTPKIEVASALSGRLLNAEKEMNAAYRTKKESDGSSLAESFNEIMHNECNVILAIGPDAAMPVPFFLAEDECTYLYSIQKESPVSERLNRCLSALYQKGVDLNWKEIEKETKAERTLLPTYPYQEQRYWLAPAAKSFSEPLAGINLQNENIAGDVKETVEGIFISQLKDISALSEPEIIERMDFPFLKWSLDSLMLVNIRLQIIKAFPGLKSMPMELFTEVSSIKKIVDYACLHANTAPPSPGADPFSFMNKALEQFIKWEKEFSPDLIVRVDKQLVHKDHERNVLIARTHKLEEDIFLAEMNQDISHSFFYEHSKDHVTSLYLIEAVSQFGRAVPHLYYNVAYDRSFIVNNISSNFDRFASVDKPLFLVLRVTDKTISEGSLRHMTTECSLVQQGEIIGKITGSGSFMAKEKYAAARRSVIL